jgi:hypothetical protein
MMTYWLGRHLKGMTGVPADQAKWDEREVHNSVFRLIDSVHRRVDTAAVRNQGIFRA